MSTISATAPAVFITVPKYLALTSNNNASSLPKIRPANLANLTAVTPAASPSYSGYASSVSEDGAAPKGKKRRLDHLSWEEKVQRKKLKNRVAAQTSRDRKKARMEEMENEIDELTQRTEILQNKCESIQTINESLMAKNQKLDMEVELLRQELTELQQQQKQQLKQSKLTVTCAGCESILNGSAAGINIHDGLPVDTSVRDTSIAQDQYSGCVVADCSSLPALQDMLVHDILSNDEEEFDSIKLEELAESLLADITADMEAGDRACNATSSEAAGRTERLSGSVVGTTAECLESSQHSQAHSIVSLEKTTNTEIELQNQTEEFNGNCKQHTQHATISKDPDFLTPDTVYGTYDAKTNSITIVMEDGSVSVNEAVEEIYCDGIAPPSCDDFIKCPTPAASPSQVYLNVDSDSDDEDVLNFDPISEFLCPKRPKISPLLKSPETSIHSAYSDHGYESNIGSPTTTTAAISEEPFEDIVIDDFDWHDSSFNDLFPTLI